MLQAAGSLEIMGSTAPFSNGKHLGCKSEALYEVLQSAYGVDGTPSTVLRVLHRVRNIELKSVVRSGHCVTQTELYRVDHYNRMQVGSSQYGNPAFLSSVFLPLHLSFSSTLSGHIHTHSLSLFNYFNTIFFELHPPNLLTPHRVPGSDTTGPVHFRTL